MTDVIVRIGPLTTEVSHEYIPQYSRRNLD